MPEWLQWTGGVTIFVALIYLFLRTGLQTRLIFNNEENIIHTRRHIKFKEGGFMYLVGDFSFSALTDKRVKFKQSVTDDDLAKAKEDSDYQIIDLANRTCYDPVSDKWSEISTG